MTVPEYLAGRPTKRLVKLVRMILRNYGIKPRGQQWRATWIWAHAISISYYYPHWPTVLSLKMEKPGLFTVRAFRFSKQQTLFQHYIDKNFNPHAPNGNMKHTLPSLI